MLNEEQLAIRQIQRRLTSLTSSAESFQSYLNKLSITSESSQGLVSLAVATSEFLSLTTEGLAALQSGADLSYWTNASTRLLSLRGHWRTALESLSDWQYSQDCDCEDPF